MAGSNGRVALIAACTSRAAPLMSRSEPNCRVMLVFWRELLEVRSVTSAISPSRRSSGVATLVAITSGLAPGRVADTLIVFGSTLGSEATGSTK